MYWLINAYDVLDKLHIRVRCVADDDQDGVLTNVFIRNTVVDMPEGFGPSTDGFKALLDELNDLAYYSQDR